MRWATPARQKAVNQYQSPNCAACLLPTAYCQLPTVNCQLPTANCLLPTGYCLLPTSFITAAGSARPPGTLAGSKALSAYRARGGLEVHRPCCNITDTQRSPLDRLLSHIPERFQPRSARRSRIATETACAAARMHIRAPPHLPSWNRVSSRLLAVEYSARLHIRAACRMKVL